MMYEDVVNILPEILLSGVALLFLMIGVFYKSEMATKIITSFAGISFLVTLGMILCCQEYGQKASSFGDSIVVDDFSDLIKSFICLVGFAVMVICRNDNYYVGRNFKCFEFPVLVTLAVVGSFLLVSANDLIVMYMGLELLSLSSYIMVATDRDNLKANEAAVKYFILGALSSCLILFGSSLIYGFTGSLNLTDLEIEFLLAFDVSDIVPAVTIGIVLVLVGFFFKISAVPMHMWAPDVYEGSTRSVLSFISTIPKIAALAFIIRFTSSFGPDVYPSFGLIFAFVAGASMIVGAFAALRQENIKRLLAYSSIANIGFILIAISIGTQSAYQAALIYTFIYIISLIGLVGMITMLEKEGEDFSKISSLSGIAKNSPIYALVFSVFLFSVAGIPPLAGFWGKFYVFIEAIKAKSYTLAFIGIISSVVACYYYLRIIKVMYFDNSNEGTASVVKSGILLRTMIFAVLVFTVLVSLYVSEFSGIIENALYSLY